MTEEQAERLLDALDAIKNRLAVFAISTSSLLAGAIAALATS